MIEAEIETKRKGVRYKMRKEKSKIEGNNERKEG